MKVILKRVYHWIFFKKQLFCIVKALWRPPRAIYQHLHFSGPFAVPFDGGRFLINQNDLFVENTIFWEGLEKSWEGVSLSLWLKLCKESSLVIDVGANTGVYSLAAKAVNPACQVHAFEPIERILDKFTKNCELNDYDVIRVKKALSNYDGKGDVYDLPAEHIYSVTVNKNTNDPDVPVIKLQIEVVQLATYLKSLPGVPKVDLIKLDVETHEPEVLEGMREFLERDRPAMLIEILTDEVGARVEALVKNCGYLYFDINEMGKPQHQKHVLKGAGYNYLFCDAATAADLGLAY